MKLDGNGSPRSVPTECVQGAMGSG